VSKPQDPAQFVNTRAKRASPVIFSHHEFEDVRSPKGRRARDRCTLARLDRVPDAPDMIVVPVGDLDELNGVSWV